MRCTKFDKELSVWNSKRCRLLCLWKKLVQETKGAAQHLTSKRPVIKRLLSKCPAAPWWNSRCPETTAGSSPVSNSKHCVVVHFQHFSWNCTTVGTGCNCWITLEGCSESRSRDRFRQDSPCMLWESIWGACLEMHHWIFDLQVCNWTNTFRMPSTWRIGHLWTITSLFSNYHNDQPPTVIQDSEITRNRLSKPGLWRIQDLVSAEVFRRP
jgi:hypothetical protein